MAINDELLEKGINSVDVEYLNLLNKILTNGELKGVLI